MGEGKSSKSFRFGDWKEEETRQMELHSCLAGSIAEWSERRAY